MTIAKCQYPLRNKKSAKYNGAMENAIDPGPERKKAGRPAGSRNRYRKNGVRINLYLEQPSFHDLWTLARSRGESRNQTVEAMVREWMGRMPAEAARQASEAQP